MSADLERAFNSRALLAICFLLLVAGVFNDPPWKWYDAAQQIPTAGEPAHVVASLLKYGSFANPYAPLETGPTAHVAPVFPLVQFALVKLFGDGAAGWLALRWLPSLALSLQFALLPFLARAIGFSPWLGIWAALFGLISKPGKVELWETHLTGLVSILLTFCFCRLAKNAVSLAVSSGIGILGGVAFLLQPLLAPVYFALVASVVPWRDFRTKSFLALCLCPLLICAPWIVRNRQVIGALGIRDNFGLELYVSFNDCAPYGVVASQLSSCFTSLHPNASLQEALQVRDLGEYEYNSDRFQRAVYWIRQHPGRTVQLLAQRFWFFWFPSDDGWNGYRLQRGRILVAHFLTIASIAGLLLALKRNVPGSRMLLIWLVLFPPAYYLVQFDTRYRYPILWVTWLSAAYCFSALRHAFRDRISS